MFRSFASAFGVIFFSLSVFAVCPDQGEFAAHECANEGDRQAALGDYTGALSRWKKSCKMGLDSSCQDFLKYKDKDAFHAEFVVSEIFKKCSSVVSPVKECHKLATDEIDDNEVEAEKIFRYLCERNYGPSCLQLGVLRLGYGAKRTAQQSFVRGCKVGNQTSCLLAKQGCSYPTTS